MTPVNGQILPPEVIFDLARYSSFSLTTDGYQMGSIQGAKNDDSSLEISIVNWRLSLKTRMVFDLKPKPVLDLWDL